MTKLLALLTVAVLGFGCSSGRKGASQKNQSEDVFGSPLPVVFEKTIVLKKFLAEQDQAELGRATRDTILTPPRFVSSTEPVNA